jgi:hypothetical protein
LREIIFSQGEFMKGSKIAPWISIFAGLLWFYAAVMANEKRQLAIMLGVVFLILGLVQLKVNRVRLKEENNPPPDKEAG